MKHKHHIVPRHAGGTNDPSNLIELSVEEHAEAHKILWEKYNRYQDYYAWQGLSGLIGKENIIKGIMNQPEMKEHLSKKSKEFWNNLSEADKEIKRNQFLEVRKLTTGSKGKTWILSEESKKNVADSKSHEWFITYPNGQKERIKNLRNFCRQNKLDQGAMFNVAKGKNKHHKGYICQKVGI